MKHLVLMGGLCIVLALVPTERSFAQLEIVDEIIKAAIEAVDLGIQKIQNETLILQDGQKALENAMAELQLTEITGWVRQQRDLYSGYYNELWQVKDVISTYKKVRALIDKQLQLVNDYKRDYALVESDPHFSAAEVSHMQAVLDVIFKQSVSNVDQVGIVLKSFATRMEDGDRLRIVDETSRRVNENSSLLNRFMQENVLLSLQRAKSEGDVQSIKALYGVQ